MNSSAGCTKRRPGISATSASSKSRRWNNARKSNGKRFRVDDLAADIWDAAELEDATPLAEWVGQQPESDSLAILLDERPAVLSKDVMFSPNTVYFGKGRKGHIDCQSRGRRNLLSAWRILAYRGR